MKLLVEIYGSSDPDCPVLMYLLGPRSHLYIRALTAEHDENDCSYLYDTEWGYQVL